MRQCERKRYAAAHGNADNVGPLYTERIEQAHSVLGHHGDGIGNIRFAGAAHAAVVEGDHLTAFRKQANDIGMTRVVGNVVRKPADEVEGLAVAVDFVINIDVVDFDGGHRTN